MKRKSQRFAILVGALVMVVSAFVNAPPLRAQTVTGTVLGTVRDQTGAVVPNASVSAKSLETGAERTAVTDSSGSFRIVSVPAGAYEVSASAMGFKTEVQSGQTLTVGGLLRTDFTLSVGAVAEKVEVTGEAPQVNTTTATMAGMMAETTIRELPLNGRDWLQLAILQPGVVQAQAQGGGGAGGSVSHGVGRDMSISGGRPSNNVFLVDGLVVNDFSNFSPAGAMGANLGVDAIREFSVLTNSYSAEYGRGSGGVINSITKSGTNALHGSAFYFIRNSDLDARNFFDIPTIPPFRRNQFGGSVGGPIKKDKLFFFANYEGLRQFLSLSDQSFVPSPSTRSGVLCANSACTSSTTVAIAPSIMPYLAFYPLPNGPITGQTGTYFFAAPKTGTENYEIDRVDYQLSASTLLTGSYTYDYSHSLTPNGLDEKVTSLTVNTQRVVLSLQHIFSPSVLDTIRVGVNRVVGTDAVDVAAIDPLLNDVSLGFLPGRGVGAITVPGLAGVAGLNSAGFNYYWYTDPQFKDDLGWVKGRNNIRIGFSVEALATNVDAPNVPAGNWTFGSIQGFLTDAPTQFNADFPTSSPAAGIRTKIFGTYIQDDLRLKSNLTLNLGLRWEPATPVTAVNSKEARIVHITDAAPTIGGAYYANNTWRNIDPRVGLAWDPFGTGKTSVRAGFGIYAVDTALNLFQNKAIRSAPFFLGGTLVNPPPSSFPNGAINLITPSSLRTQLIDPTPHTAYKLQWNFNIQQQITRGLALTVGYVGSRGVHLPTNVSDTDQVPPSLVTVAPDGNLQFPTAGAVQRINPNFGQISALHWYGYNFYNSLQVNLVQQLRHGFSVQGTYLWSKNMDLGSSEYVGSDLANSNEVPYAFMPNLNKGVADFNIPQNLVVNFLWDTPSPHSLKAVSRFLLSGWELSGIFTAQSGSPFSVQFLFDEARTGASTVTSSANGGGQRPNYVPGPGCKANATNPGNIDNYINLSCYSFPALGQLGNTGRNTLIGPGLEDFDFSVFKNHNLLGEKLKVQFRAEFFNLFNRANFIIEQEPIFNSLGNLLPTAGVMTSPTVTTSRQIQFGLKLLW